MTTFYRLFPIRLKKGVILISSLLSAALFIIVNLFIFQAIYFELTIFKADSAALGIPVWIYYAGVPLLSVFVFMGVYRDAATRLSELSKEGAR